MGIHDPLLRVREACKSEYLEKLLTYIKNGLGQWYTYLLYPEIESTNNLAEQVMREHVLMRKIIGTFRSENGAEYYQYIASIFATWRLKGQTSMRDSKNYSKMNFV